MDNKDELVIITPSTETIDGLDDDYKDLLVEVQNDIMKRGVQAVALDQRKYALSSDEWVYELPHPIRKKWAGLLPLHIECLVQEERNVAAMMKVLSGKDVCISLLVRNLFKNSPSFRELAQAGNAHESSANLGAMDTAFYPHTFYAKGSRLFKIDDDLTAMLDKTDLGLKTPAGFLQPPFANMFIAAKPNFTIYNAMSGDHQADGFYLNTYTYEADLVSDLVSNTFEGEGRKDKLSGFLRDKGLIVPDGGEIRVFEILACGRPKENTVDDATFSFSITIQDPTVSVSELVEAHIEYYTTQTDGHDGTLEGIKFINTDEKHAQQLRNCVEFVSKALLYINSDDCIREKVMELSDLKIQQRRTQNKAKKRKLQRKINRSSDYVLISYPIETGAKTEGSTRSKSAHWRRGHFREQRYGEKNANVKIIWIKPVIVGKNKPSSKEYRVK